MPIASLAILVYAAILVIGGFIGWRLSGDRMRFTSSLISAAMLTIAYRLSRISPRAGYLMGMAITVILTVMFAVRLKKTRKLVPSGILLLVSVAVVITLAWTAITG